MERIGAPSWQRTYNQAATWRTITALDFPRAASLWAKGKDFYAYAAYLWDIVYAYFDNLKEHGSYDPLHILERKPTTIRDKEGSNWLAARMVQLRRSYLAYLGKPQNIAEAIRQYNSTRHRDNKKIVNSEDLIHRLKEVFETDLTQWIEGAEGAYDLLLSGRVYKAKRQQYEKLVQKTLKSQIEYILQKRGFQAEVLREPQLLDEKTNGSAHSIRVRRTRGSEVNLQYRYVDGCARTIPVLREHAAIHARLRRVSRHFPGHR